MLAIALVSTPTTFEVLLFFESEEVREYSRHCWNAAEFTIDNCIHSCLSPISKTVRDPGGLFLEISTFGLNKSSGRAFLGTRSSEPPRHQPGKGAVGYTDVIAGGKRKLVLTHYHVLEHIWLPSRDACTEFDLIQVRIHMQKVASQPSHHCCALVFDHCCLFSKKGISVETAAVSESTWFGLTVTYKV